LNLSIFIPYFLFEICSGRSRFIEKEEFSYLKTRFSLISQLLRHHKDNSNSTRMNHLNAALLSLMLIASAVNVLAAPTDDSEKYQFHVQVN
jgi:hypothetical protein